jgi:hypothetical protein
MRDYCIEMGLYFDEQGKLRRRVARDREVALVQGYWDGENRVHPVKIHSLFLQ